MKQLVLKYFTGYLFIILISACQQPYFQDNLDSSRKIPVIQGSVNNGPGPYEVTLFWASLFGSTQRDPIEDATVFIYDDQGNQEPLTMLTPGYYKTSTDDFEGIPGRTYTLHVVLPNGDIYESTPTRLDTIPLTYLLYEQIGTQEDYTTGSYGEVLITTYRGLHYFVDMNLNTNQKYYYHYTAKMVYQHIYYSDIITRYAWDVSYLKPIPNIKATIENNNEQIIKEHQLGFIRYRYEINDPVPAGWILTTNIYSISNKVFNYYQSIIKQQNSDNQIFDPVSAQVIGNVKCLTDTTKIALGIFEVASNYLKKTAIYWIPGLKDIRKVELPPDYELPSKPGYTINTPPDFWVYF